MWVVRIAEGMAAIGAAVYILLNLVAFIARWRQSKKWLPCLLLCLAPTVAEAQLWSGVVDTTRATDWTGAGVTGGIPTTRTQCGSTIAAGTSAASIDSSISACSAGTFVLLGAGTFNLSAGLNLKAGVTLRGSGPDSTFLVFSNDTGCAGQFTLICAYSGNLSYYAPGPPSNVVDWTAHFTRGDTTITVSATTGLSVGMYIMLDGDDTGIVANDLVVCSVITTCTSESGGGASANQRTGAHAQREMFKVTNISGTDVTLDHGLRYPQWSSVANKKAWWGSSSGMITGVGLEDLSIERTFDSSYANIAFLFTAESWIKNVRSINAPAPRTNVLLYQVTHMEIRDSYFYGSMDESTGPTHYGIETFPAFDSKIENNIIQRRTSGIVLDGGVGNVIAYNYCVYDTYTISSTFLQGCYYSHEGGNAYNLFEGNIGPQYKTDIVHASSNLGTAFRNYFIGWEPGKTDELGAIKLYALNRFYNIIGNVLGRNGTHTGYSSSSNIDTVVYTIGHGGPVTDSFTETSLFRWGNYDVATADVRWCGNSSNTGWTTTCSSTSEVPTGITNYSTAVPATETLPNSFYLSSQPTAWWGVIGQSSIPWPPIGPDVTGQTINGTNGTTSWASQSLGGHAAPTPAMVCYKEIMGGPADGTGSALTFNASSCYTTASSSPPASTTPGNAIMFISLFEGAMLCGSMWSAYRVALLRTWMTAWILTQYWAIYIGYIATAQFLRWSHHQIPARPFPNLPYSKEKA